MRLGLIVLLASLVALPVAGQTVGPLTGSTGITEPVPGAGAGAGAAARPAARRGRMRMQERFDAANTTHDGKLTLEQARAGRMPRVANNFDAIDVKKNGYVTVEDIRAYNRAQRGARAKP